MINREAKNIRIYIGSDH